MSKEAEIKIHQPVGPFFSELNGNLVLFIVCMFLFLICVYEYWWIDLQTDLKLLIERFKSDKESKVPKGFSEIFMQGC